MGHGSSVSHGRAAHRDRHCDDRWSCCSSRRRWVRWRSSSWPGLSAGGSCLRRRPGCTHTWGCRSRADLAPRHGPSSLPAARVARVGGSSWTRAPMARWPCSRASTAPARSSSVAGTWCFRCSRQSSCHQAGSATVNSWQAMAPRRRSRVHCSRFRRFLEPRVVHAQRVQGAAIALVAIFLPGALLVYASLPFWNMFRAAPRVPAGAERHQRGVVGILLAALYLTIWSQTVHQPSDFGVVVVAFALLTVWKRRPGKWCCSVPSLARRWAGCDKPKDDKGRSGGRTRNRGPTPSTASRGIERGGARVKLARWRIVALAVRVHSRDFRRQAIRFCGFHDAGADSSSGRTGRVCERAGHTLHAVHAVGTRASTSVLRIRISAFASARGCCSASSRPSMFRPSCRSSVPSETTSVPAATGSQLANIASHEPRGSQPGDRPLGAISAEPTLISRPGRTSRSVLS